MYTQLPKGSLFSLTIAGGPFQTDLLKLTPRIITFAFSLSFMGMRIMRLSHSDKHTHTPFEVTENE